MPGVRLTSEFFLIGEHIVQDASLKSAKFVGSMTKMMDGSALYAVKSGMCSIFKCKNIIFDI